MNHYQNILFDVGRIILAGLLIIAGFLMLSLILSLIDSNNVHAQGADHSTSNLTVDMSESPNVVTSSLVSLSTGLGDMTDSTIQASNDGIQALAAGTTHTSKVIVRSVGQGAQATVRGLGSGIGFAGNTISGSVTFIFGIPGNALSLIASAPIINTIIRPSDHQNVPLIDPNSPELLAALTALPPTAAETNASQAVPQSTSGPVWPIQGRITTRFGVSHRPYQDTHTGIDISDGQRSGVTPVRPFRSGHVIEAIHSRYGYGNHVIVDHGNGVTSVYAHLSSIAIIVGQDITTDNILGLEGSTGLSTGTHLHFEIRVNGRAADPHKFISGKP